MRSLKKVQEILGDHKDGDTVFIALTERRFGAFFSVVGIAVDSDLVFPTV